MRGRDYEGNAEGIIGGLRLVQTMSLGGNNIEREREGEREREREREREGERGGVRE